MSVEQVNLHGERAERFRELRQQTTDRPGYEPSNAEAIGIIVAEFPERYQALVR